MRLRGRKWPMITLRRLTPQYDTRRTSRDLHTRRVPRSSTGDISRSILTSKSERRVSTRSYFIISSCNTTTTSGVVSEPALFSKFPVHSVSSNLGCWECGASQEPSRIILHGVKCGVGPSPFGYARRLWSTYGA